MHILLHSTQTPPQTPKKASISYLLRLHHTVMVQILVEEDALGLGLGLVLGTQLANLAVVRRPCGLGCWIHRYQVHNSGNNHQKCQDGTDDDGC